VAAPFTDAGAQSCGVSRTAGRERRGTGPPSGDSSLSNTIAGGAPAKTKVPVYGTSSGTHI